jgi:hypothetical protein
VSSAQLAAIHTPPPSDHSRQDDPVSPASVSAEPTADGKLVSDPPAVVTHSVVSGTCCSYCGTTSTVQWRQDRDGGIVCNNCGTSQLRVPYRRMPNAPSLRCRGDRRLLPCLIAYPHRSRTHLITHLRFNFSCTHTPHRPVYQFQSSHTPKTPRS